eukprot:g16210.t1
MTGKQLDWSFYNGNLGSSGYRFYVSGFSRSCQDVCLAISFDHEEVGSQSFTGADGATLPSWLERTMNALDVASATQPELLTRSFLISADCAHGLHPNYAAKHQAEHRPSFHKGIVIKTNANQRYATTPLTAALFREVCKRSDVPVQDFVVRNDSPCGSTIGRKAQRRFRPLAEKTTTGCVADSGCLGRNEKKHPPRAPRS